MLQLGSKHNWNDNLNRNILKCCNQGQKMAQCCYQGRKVAGKIISIKIYLNVVIRVKKQLTVGIRGKKLLSVGIRVSFGKIDVGLHLFYFCILLNQNCFLLNLQIYIEFETLYKIVSKMFVCFLMKNHVKINFFSEDTFFQ